MNGSRTKKRKPPATSWGTAIELTAGQLQVAASGRVDDSFSLHLVATADHPVLSEEGALAFLQLVHPQVVLKEDSEEEEYRLTGCVDLTRRLIACLQPETEVRCILLRDSGEAKTRPAAMLGTLMYKVCSIADLVSWAVQPAVWSWWHTSHPTIRTVARFFDLGRDQANVLLREIAGRQAAAKVADDVVPKSPGP